MREGGGAADASEISEAETAIEESNGRHVDVTLVESPTPKEEAVVELSQLTNSNVSKTRS